MSIVSKFLTGLACLLILATPSKGAVVVTFDPATLNDLISSVAVRRIEVPIAGGRSVEVLLDKLEVQGFRPADGGGRADHILTRLSLRVPQFGLQVALKPHLSLQVVRRGESTSLELRFEEVVLPLPFGRIDLAPLLPPIRYPADSAFLLAGASGDVEVRSRVAHITMTEDLLRFEIALDVVPPALTRKE